MRLSHWMSGLALSAATLTAWAAGPQSYPDRPITWVVPYSPGGGVDATARTMGKYVGEILHVPIVIENKPGPGGTIGGSYVARAPADGYTFLVGGSGPLSISPYVIKGMSYDPQKDLKTLSLLVTIPQILVVNSKSKYSDFASLKAAAKHSNLSIGYGGNGTGQQLSALLFQRSLGVEMTLVPYKGTSNVINDLLGGVIDAAFVDPTSMGLVNSGELRAFAVTTPKRSIAYPNLPTLEELGLKGAEFQSFYALSAPAGISDEVQKKMSAAVHQALTNPEVQKVMLLQGMEAHPTTGAEAAAFIKAHSEKSGQLLKSIN